MDVLSGVLYRGRFGLVGARHGEEEILLLGAAVHTRFNGFLLLGKRSAVWVCSRKEAWLDANASAGCACCAGE